MNWSTIFALIRGHFTREVLLEILHFAIEKLDLEDLFESLIANARRRLSDEVLAVIRAFVWLADQLALGSGRAKMDFVQSKVRHGVSLGSQGLLLIHKESVEDAQTQQVLNEALRLGDEGLHKVSRELQAADDRYINQAIEAIVEEKKSQ